MPRIPFLGCVGQLVKLAVILLILIVMGTCWFFGGSGIMIGDAGRDHPTVTSAAPATAVDAGRNGR